MTTALYGNMVGIGLVRATGIWERKKGQTSVVGFVKGAKYTPWFLHTPYICGPVPLPIPVPVSGGYAQQPVCLSLVSG
jgi:hypothetical protein